MSETGKLGDGDERAADMIRMYKDMEVNVKEGKFKPMEILRKRLEHHGPTCEYPKKEYTFPSDEIIARDV